MKSLKLAALALLLASCRENPLLPILEQRVEESNGPVRAPVISPAPESYVWGQPIAIESPTAGAEIHYTDDGTTPTISTTRYSGPITLSGERDSVVIKAIAVAEGRPSSSVTEATYSIDRNRVAIPIASSASGWYAQGIEIELSCATAGASISYSLDGSDPFGDGGSQYSGPIEVAVGLTLRAGAIKDGMTPSAIAELVYEIAPEAPAALQAIAVAPTSLTLSWAPVSDATVYKLFRDTSEDGDFDSAVYEGSATQFVNNGLSGSTAYWYKVSAGTASGFGVPSAAIECLTEFATAPTDGGRIAYSDQRLSWSQLASATGYEVQISDTEIISDSDPAPVEVGAAEFLLAPELDEGQVRHWRLRAVLADGARGPWSGQGSFTVGGYQNGEIGPGGGLVVYTKGAYTDGWKHLELLPEIQDVESAWGPAGAIADDTFAGIGYGPANTQAILDSLGPDAAAARLCSEVTINGYDDWFLPSIDELAEAYSAVNLLDSYHQAVYGFDWLKTYWSSTEYDETRIRASQGGGSFESERHVSRLIRPMRRF